MRKAAEVAQEKADQVIARQKRRNRLKTAAKVAGAAAAVAGAVVLAKRAKARNP
jgi:hypothetical protein